MLPCQDQLAEGSATFALELEMIKSGGQTLRPIREQMLSAGRSPLKRIQVRPRGSWILSEIAALSGRTISTVAPSLIGFGAILVIAGAAPSLMNRSPAIRQMPSVPNPPFSPRIVTGIPGVTAEADNPAKRRRPVRSAQRAARKARHDPPCGIGPCSGTCRRIPPMPIGGPLIMPTVIGVDSRFGSGTVTSTDSPNENESALDPARRQPGW